MKGSFTLTISGKEAVALLAYDLPKSLTSKIVKAFRGADVTPVGEKNARVAQASKKTGKKTNLKAVEDEAKAV